MTLTFGLAALTATSVAGWTSTGPAVAATQAGQPPVTSVFAPPTGLWLIPSDGSGPYYGPTSPRANWTIAQWGTPQDLPPFSHHVTANSAERVADLGDGVALTQTTPQLSCGTSAPPEFDLYAQPNGNPAYPSAARDVTPAANLAALSGIHFGITVKPLVMRALSNPCEPSASPGINQGNLLSAVILSDPSAGQTFFYQMQLDHYRLDSTDPYPPQTWFFNGSNDGTGIYGFDDNAGAYGQKEAVLGQSATYGFQLLPRLKQLIMQASQYGMDQDLSHWFINGAYYGQGAWGHVDVSSRWNNFTLTVTTRQ